MKFETPDEHLERLRRNPRFLNGVRPIIPEGHLCCYHDGPRENRVDCKNLATKVLTVAPHTYAFLCEKHYDLLRDAPVNK